MRRVLTCAVAIEIVIGVLALAIVSDASAGRTMLGAPKSLAAGGELAGSKSGAVARECDGEARRSAGQASSGAPGAPSGKKAVSGAERSGEAKGISFKLPVDFSTGAIPSADAFNKAEGDQLGLFVLHTPLTDSVAVGDFNGDGKPDVAQTNVLAGTVSVLLGDGRGGFALPRQNRVGDKPLFVVAGHLDQNGALDLAVADFGSNDVAVLLGNGDGSFQPARFFPVPAPRNVAIGRFNRDQFVDLAVASGAPSLDPSIESQSPVGGTALLMGGPAGTFSPGQFITHTQTFDGRPASANVVAVGDFDGSGLDDLAIGVGTSRKDGDVKAGRVMGDDLLVFLNRDGQQPFATTPDQPAIRVGGTPDSIAVSDWNGDGHLDLAVLSGFTGDLTTLLGDSEGRFRVKAVNVTVGALPRALAVGDFNDDGVSDLVAASFLASTVSVLEGNRGPDGNGDGTFQPAVDFWSGGAPTGVAVGHFNDDARLDVVVGRLRTDHLALLANDSPQPGDGVRITHDVYYVSSTQPSDDPFAAHHRLDVYSPPKGTPSFAGKGRRYPVVLFAHGGRGITGDKSGASYLMRSLAREGIVAISTDYRLGPGAGLAEAVADVVQAFRWTRDNVGAKEFGGDPDSVFVAGTSAGANTIVRLGIEGQWNTAQHIRGMVLHGSADLGEPSPNQPPSLIAHGTDGLDRALTPTGVRWAEDSRRIGRKSKHVILDDRDHLTAPAYLAHPDDEGRRHVLEFIRPLLG